MILHSKFMHFCVINYIELIDTVFLIISGRGKGGEWWWHGLWFVWLREFSLNCHSLLHFLTWSWTCFRFLLLVVTMSYFKVLKLWYSNFEGFFDLIWDNFHSFSDALLCQKTQCVLSLSNFKVQNTLDATYYC